MRQNYSLNECDSVFNSTKNILFSRCAKNQKKTNFEKNNYKYLKKITNLN